MKVENRQVNFFEIQFMRKLINMKIKAMLFSTSSEVGQNQNCIKNPVKHLGCSFQQKQLRAQSCQLFPQNAQSQLFVWVLNMPQRTQQQNMYSTVTSRLPFFLLADKYDRYFVYNSRAIFMHVYQLCLLVIIITSENILYSFMAIAIL